MHVRETWKSGALPVETGLETGEWEEDRGSCSGDMVQVAVFIINYWKLVVEMRQY